MKSIFACPCDITLGYSPCPNDTFIFHALVHRRVVVPGCRITEALHDVETLNQLAMDGALDVTKLSFYAWLKLKDRYRLLNAGAAMGHGCGPILVAARRLKREDFHRCRVVLPGEWTTAHLLLRLWAPEFKNRMFTTYDRVLDTILADEADCGVIIHENRFTYQKKGVRAIVDLGEWWEQETALPIPLGCIAARADLPEHLVTGIESAIRRSIQEALAQPEHALPYIRQYAQEMEADVLKQHIHTFVNDYSLDLGKRGHTAVAILEKKAREAGVIP